MSNNSTALTFEGATREFLNDMATADFALRCAISGLVSAMLYFTFGFVFNTLFPRPVQNRDVYNVLDLRADISLSLQGVLFGTPIISAFMVANDKFGISKAYTDISLYGWGYWLLSIPLYLLLWDMVFYVLHLVLHWEPMYQYSHRWHHAFRPPTAWSGIAVDPLETMLSGLAPFLVPLFIMPMHLYTAYAINIALEGWATMLHSSCHWPGTWLFIGAIDHNTHHEKGRMNGNYGAIFTLWDRMFGTFLRDVTPQDKQPYWIVAERQERRQQKTRKGKKGE